VLVDIDVGWGGAFNIGRTIKEFIKAGAAGVHIEDQVAAKRCGHRPGKQVVSTEEMADRVKAAVDARDATDPDFVIMARTDAFASHGMDAALERSQACIDAGADMLFPEALFALEHYRTFNGAFPNTPILANITEFGKTELFSQDELGANGVSLVLYPLSAHRAMARAAMEVYGSILANGHQKEVVPLMQTRAELYDILDYHTYEDKLDGLFKDGKGGV
jgi:methylisocitrate lyase